MRRLSLFIAGAACLPVSLVGGKSVAQVPPMVAPGAKPPVPPVTVVLPSKPPAPPPGPMPPPATRVISRPVRDETCSPRADGPVSEVHAGGGSDRVWAGDQPGKLYGDADEDFVGGGPSNDEIHGGTGADILVGGAGSDLFVFDTPDDSPTDENGEWSVLSGDTVVDFTTPDFDKFDLRPLQTGQGAPPVRLHWSGRRPAAFGVWTQPRAGDTVFLIDLDGNAVADMAARLIGTITLDASNFCGVARAAQ